MAAHNRSNAQNACLSARNEGIFTRMIRLWIEHHERMLDCGAKQF